MAGGTGGGETIMVAQDAHDPRGNDSHAVHAHAAPSGFIRKYIFSLDHKVIGIQYWLLGLLAVLIGMTLSVLVRFHLVWPDARIPLLHLLSPTGAKGDVIQPEYYLSLLTLH